MSIIDRHRNRPVVDGYPVPRMDVAAANQVVDELSRRWHDACGYLSLGRMISTGAGPTVGMRPQVIEVSPPGYSDRPRMLIRLQPGQICLDLEEKRAELAAALGVFALRFEDHAGTDFVTVHLVASDPLARVVPFLPSAPADHLVLGVADDGRTVSRPLDAITHSAIAGSSGTGKSACLYSLLIQFARMGPWVDVAGIDPTGLLWRPWGEHPCGWRIGGTADAAERYPALLRQLVAEMDRRIEAIPERCDSLPISESDPLLVVVLEEMSGISRLTGYKSSGTSETQRHVSRLASEGRKAGMRLIVCSQQLSSGVIGTDVRDQLLTRMSFGCRDLGTLRMLSPDATPEDLAPLAQSPAGVCLLDAAGESLTRMRAPWVGDYATYYDWISAATQRPVLRSVVA